MKALSLFSGIGGIDLACEWAKIETVAFCEREPFCQKVLKKHWSGVPIYDDVCTLTKERLDADGIGTIDIIHGGYPCQPFSLAGNREGEADDRHLWPEVFRLIQTVQPKWFVGENVAGHITLGLDIVLSDLDSIGYSAEAFVIPACAVDARHRRDRVFIVAYSKRIASIERSEFDMFRRWKEEAEQAWLGGSGENVAYANRVTRLEAYKEAGTIGSRRKPRDNVSGGSWKCKPGNDWWETEPQVGRMVDGFSARLDEHHGSRLKALGNAVVPQQIYPILAAIKQIDDMMRAG